MKSKYLAVLLAITLSACGGVKNYVEKQPGDLAKFKQVSVGTVAVSSKESNPDATAFNAQWKSMLTDRLQGMLQDRGRLASKAKTRVDAQVHVVYGNRALRYWVGFGAGAGSIRIVIELKDAAGSVVYSTRTEADLGMGMFGGDMSKVASKAIDAAVADFGKRI
jgi:hypothetical protein